MSEILQVVSLRFFPFPETIAYLKNYAIGEAPNISIGVALEEAEKILKEIQQRSFDASHEITRIELTWEKKEKVLLYIY